MSKRELTELSSLGSSFIEIILKREKIFIYAKEDSKKRMVPSVITGA